MPLSSPVLNEFKLRNILLPFSYNYSRFDPIFIENEIFQWNSI